MPNPLPKFIEKSPMNINISELNEIAQVIACGLKQFRPETMFFHKKNAVAFSNYDRFEVQPYRNIKKPFGVQAVLESIARSLGYNTYKGMLESGAQEFQLQPSALFDLNPNPLNGFYTDCWEELTSIFMQQILSNNVFSSTVMRNFKPVDTEKYGGFDLRGGVNFLCFAESFSDMERDHTVKLEKKYGEILPVAAMAQSIYFQAIEKYIEQKGFKDWFESDELDMSVPMEITQRMFETPDEEITLPFRDFLVRKEWGDSNYSKFMKAIEYALRQVYGVKSKFVGSGRSPLDKDLVITLGESDIRRRMYAKFSHKAYQNFQEACKQLFEKYADDKQLYSSYEDIDSIERRYCANYLRATKDSPWSVDKISLTNIGTKNYWINMSSSWVFGEDDSGLLGVSDFFDSTIKSIQTVERMAKKIEDFLSKCLVQLPVQLELKTPHTRSHKYQYKYNIKSEEGDWLSIPSSVMLLSDYPLKHYVGELFIQDKLVEWLGGDVDGKIIGYPDCFDLDIGKEVYIEPTKSPKPVDVVWVFDPLYLVQSLSLYVDFYGERDKLSEEELKEEPQPFKGVETETELNFTVSVKLIDTPYKFRDYTFFESGYSELAMSIKYNKQTQNMSAEHRSPRTKQIEDFEFQAEVCPLTREIYDYLMEFKELKELILKFFLEFYQGSKRSEFEEGYNNDLMWLEVKPADLLKREFTINDIVKSQVVGL